MKVTNIHDAKTHLSRLIERAAAGEEVIIARAGKPVARLIRYDEDRPPRQGGQWRNQVRIADDFDAPLPDDVQSAFNGEAE